MGWRDLFCPEDREYARRLEEAGVPCEYHEVPGAYHAFERFNAQAGVAQDVQRRGLGLAGA